MLRIEQTTTVYLLLRGGSKWSAEHFVVVKFFLHQRSVWLQQLESQLRRGKKSLKFFLNRIYHLFKCYVMNSSCHNFHCTDLRLWFGFVCLSNILRIFHNTEVPPVRSHIFFICISLCYLFFKYSFLHCFLLLKMFVRFRVQLTFQLGSKSKMRLQQFFYNR